MPEDTGTARGERAGLLCYKRYKETVGGDENAHYLNCGDGFAGVCMSKHPILHIKYAQFTVNQLDFNKSVLIISN